MDSDSDGEEEFGFDCCSLLADDRHVLPFERQPESRQHQPHRPALA